MGVGRGYERERGRRRRGGRRGFAEERPRREAASVVHGMDPSAAINTDVDDDGNEALHRAATGGDAAEVRRILAIPGVDVNLKGEWEGTPLYWASRYGHSEVVKLLLAAPGIDVNRANELSETPLSVATNDEIRALLRAASATV